MAYMRDAAGNRLDSFTVRGGAENTGVYLPQGCLDRWYAAKAQSATQLVEVPIFGDSTTYGQAADDTGAVTNYSWTQRLREVAVASGYTDGGRGLVDFFDNALLGAYEGYSSLVSKTSSWHACFDFSALGVAGYQVEAASQTLVLKGKGTAIRILFTHRNQTTGAFTYSVDGGAAVSASCSGSTVAIDTIYIGGLTEGDHTLTINTQDTGTVTVAVGFIRAAGIVFNKVAKSGAIIRDWFNNQTNRNIAANLGLTDLTGQAQAPQMTQQPTPGFPRPPLAIMLLGGNDQSAATTDALALSGAMLMSSSIGNFAEACRAAKCDALVLIPHFRYFANSAAYAGHFQRAAADTARAYGLAYADMAVPLGTTTEANAAGYTYQSGLHLKTAGYKRWAEWLWANVLNRAVAP